MARIHSLVTFGPLLTVSLAGCGGTTCETARPPMPEMPGIHWADAVVQELAPSWPDDHRRPFLRVLAPLAMRSGAEHCIPPSVTVAQGILESGWGRSDNAVQLNNLFGIKASADEDGASAPTWEYIGGHRVRRNERFRAFMSWRDAVQQHDLRLSEHPAYERARAFRTSAPAFLQALAPVYATDPAYAERVQGLVERYGLRALDAPSLERARQQARCS